MTPAPAIPDRVHWAVGLLGLTAGDRVLEIGCGPGAAAQLICPMLGPGFMLAVDRSATAVARTRSRNAAQMAAGRLQVLKASLAELPDSIGTFDAAFSLNVNVFWTDPEGPELDILSGVLRPGGRLAVLYGPGPGNGSDAAGRAALVAEQARRHGFGDVRIHHGRRGSGILAARLAGEPSPPLR